ncbi:hypothetical protein J2736_001471 [Paenibacillus qinlingensis]|uniref:Uncharacterized protein n=1 Tax=Paenibacillus qinlingensis TaxID=1837343 RepID=A0ABU1NS79_9BACL|nr:hypothetical protein [Paenibacillus qinlingensis]
MKLTSILVLIKRLDMSRKLQKYIFFKKNRPFIEELLRKYILFYRNSLKRINAVEKDAYSHLS